MPSTLKFHLEPQLLLPGVRIERTKGASDVNRLVVCGREIGSLNPVRKRLHRTWSSVPDQKFVT